MMLAYDQMVCAPKRLPTMAVRKTKWNLYFSTRQMRVSYCVADTKRFEGIDSEFKELMKEAINVPMAVDACGVDGRAEGLKSMMQRLEMCQKSLNEYLDMKKKVGRPR